MPYEIKKLLTPADFTASPVWRYEHESESYFKVLTLGDLELLESTYDLRILVEFTTPSNLRLTGEIVGVQDIYAIGLFANDEIILINKNMHIRAKEQAEKFLILSGLAETTTYKNLFPMHFQSKCRSDVFNEFSGFFDMPPSV